jgi:hypothetical protein
MRRWTLNGYVALIRSTSLTRSYVRISLRGIGVLSVNEVAEHDRAPLPWRTFTTLISRMGTRTTFICDCCLREADNNLGWARIHINGASGDKQLMPDENRDLCEICWSPLQTLMNKVHDDARAKRNPSGNAI